jgi:hypothetical protein
MPGSEKARDVRLAPIGDDLRFETVERLAERLPFAQDRDPGEPGLKPVEDQLFPQRAAVPFGNAPFGVVIGDVERIVTAPVAPSRLHHRKSLQLIKNPSFNLLTAAREESMNRASRGDIR